MPIGEGVLKKVGDLYLLGTSRSDFLKKRGASSLWMLLRRNAQIKKTTIWSPESYSIVKERYLQVILKNEVARLNPHSYRAAASFNRLYPEFRFTSLRIQS
jgi:hypothetical protein